MTARAEGAEGVDLLREVVAHLRDEADFNRSQTDGRRGAPPKTSAERIAQRILVRTAERREEWATAIEALRADAEAGRREVREALRRLELANDALAAGRSQSVYLAMIDGGQQDALNELDAARREARAALATPAARPAPAVGAEAVEYAALPLSDRLRFAARTASASLEVCQLLEDAADALATPPAAPAAGVPDGVHRFVADPHHDYEREAFEAWATNASGLDISKIPDAWGRADYKHSHIGSTFRGWQAARRLAAAPSPPVPPADDTRPAPGGGTRA